MSDEQRVRTMGGWIGVEISRSRVRTPGRAGYGLYRVRGQQQVRRQVYTPETTTVSEPYWAGTEWTPYAFSLEQVHVGVLVAIERGVPSGPAVLELTRLSDGVQWSVPTRWSSAYRGSRNRGGEAVGTGVGEIVERSTVRSRQREHNAEFQAAHLERRRHGLRVRYASKAAAERARNANGRQLPG